MIRLGSGDQQHKSTCSSGIIWIYQYKGIKTSYIHIFISNFFEGLTWAEILCRDWEGQSGQLDNGATSDQLFNVPYSNFNGP